MNTNEDFLPTRELFGYFLYATNNLTIKVNLVKWMKSVTGNIEKLVMVKDEQTKLI